MTNAIMNARMYAVTPAVEAAWRSLLERITAAADVSFDYLSYPAPQPLAGPGQGIIRADFGPVGLPAS